MFSELGLDSLTTKAIAFHYVWEDTTHLLRAGVDAQKNLYIIEYRSYPPKTLSSTLAQYCREYQKYKVFSNRFHPLRAEIGKRCKQSKLDDIEDQSTFYENLVASKRFYVDIETFLPSNSKSFLLCMSLLLNGLMQALESQEEGGLLLGTLDPPLIGGRSYEAWEIEVEPIIYYGPEFEKIMKVRKITKTSEESFEGRKIIIWERNNRFWRSEYGFGGLVCSCDEIPCPNVEK